jgi:hypothetical protein
MIDNPFTYFFGATPFHPAVAEAQPMVTAPGLASSVRHVPYSNLNILDLGGKTERRYAVKIQVEPEDVATIEAALGTTDTLTVAGVVWPSATLIKLDGHTMTPRGEYHHYDAEWVVG